MGLYTKEIDELLQEGIEIFDFDYDFYTNDTNIRSRFEKKFIQKYRYHEIGFDSVDKFKHYINYKLDEIAPYYTQLYQSELKANDIDFMANKYIEEIVTRELAKNKDINNVQLKNLLSNVEGVQHSIKNSDIQSTLNNDKSKTETLTTEDVNNKNTYTNNSANTTTNGYTRDRQTTLGTNTSNGNTINSGDLKVNNNTTDKESNVRDGLANTYDNYFTNNKVGTDNSTTTDNRKTTTNNTDNINTSVTTENNSDNVVSNKQNISTNETDTFDSHRDLYNKETSIQKGYNNTKDIVDNNTTTTTSLDDTLKADTKESEINKETTTTINKGIIGVYSLADLLDKWRKVMINIDKQILEEFKEYFMLLY